MRAEKSILTLIWVFLTATAVCQATPAFKPAAGKDNCNQWIDANFRKGAVPPFSFVYGGVSSDKLLPKWRYERKALEDDKPGETLESHNWTDPKTGLRVECRVKRFTDFNAIEWCLYMHNTSAESNTLTISNMHTLDLNQKGAAGEWHVFNAEGPRFGRTDFRSRDTVLAVRDTMMLAPAGGRSSSHTMPYFNVKSKDGGIVYAVGWTGSWLAQMNHVDETTLNVRTGLKRFDAYLLPGESVQLPSIVAIPWQGEDRMDGQNILRRFIMAHHHPYENGKPLEVPVCGSFEAPNAPPCDEIECFTDYEALAGIRKSQIFGTTLDAFWIDAGWYSRAADFDKGYWWHSAVGNWTADPNRFPDGMAPISDYAHKVGSGLLLWYEPERANVDSEWAVEHPEYMISESGDLAVPVKEVIDSSFLVNYGNPEALDFVTDYMTNSLLSYGVDIYRQDFNIDPEVFWINNDKPGRTGMVEVRYINGLYKFLDTLHQRIPGLVIDNCAGGGRRLDIEMVSRAICLLRSDYSLEIEGIQCHAYDLNQWLPIHCTGTGASTDYSFHSNLGPGILFAFREKVSVPRRKEIIKKFRRYKTFFLDDYYPLSGYGDNTRDDIWLAYQLNVPRRGEGLVVAFRRKDCRESDYVVRLRGIDDSANYLLRYDGPDIPEHIISGAELSAGLTLHLDQPQSSVLIEYIRQ